MAPTTYRDALSVAFDPRSRPFARLNVAWLDERELPEAVRRMAVAAP